MFERFTQSARGVVVQAREEAFRAGHDWIGTEHVTVALAADEGIAGQALRSFGVSIDELRTALSHQATGPDRDLDADALRRIGIDLDDVRRAVERTFGEGALEEPPDQGGRRRRGSHIPFTKDAKRSLEGALRQALVLGHRSLGSEHLLLGVLDDADRSGARLLTALGVDVPRLRAATIEAARRSA